MESVIIFLIGIILGVWIVEDNNKDPRDPLAA